MLASIITTAISGLIDLGGSWFKNKREESKAKHKAKMARIEQEVTWEAEMARGSRDSWKDEFWTLVLAMPLLVLWVSVFFDLPKLQARIFEAFNKMHQLPEWYLISLGIAIGAAFGVRSFIGAMKRDK